MRLKVKEAIEQVLSNERYFVQGVTGKIYYRSWIDNKKKLSEILEHDCCQKPFFAAVIPSRPRKIDYSKSFSATTAIGIKIRDDKRQCI